MFADKQFRHREHLLRYRPLQVGGFLAVWVDTVGLLDVPGEEVREITITVSRFPKLE